MSKLSVPPVLPAPSRPRSHWPWAMALVFIVAMVIPAVLIYHVLTRAADSVQSLADLPAQLTSGLAAAFRPSTSVTTLFSTTIGELHHNSKLVVLSANVDAEVEKASATHWGYLYWGTTRVTLRAHDNVIQYVLPLDGLSTGDFRFDAVTKKLILTVPAPQLDESMISVQSDPHKLEIKTELGWAKFDSWSGAPLRQEAQADLRPAVLRVGQHELLRDRAEKNARTHLAAILAPLTDALQPGTTLDIQFALPPAKN